jgi:hypothetical protein
MASPTKRSKSGRPHVNAVASVDRVLKTASAETLSEEEVKKLLQRPRIDFSSILSTVRALRAGRAAGATAGCAAAAACGDAVARSHCRRRVAQRHNVMGHSLTTTIRHTTLHQRLDSPSATTPVWW